MHVCMAEKCTSDDKLIGYFSVEYSTEILVFSASKDGFLGSKAVSSVI